MNKFSQKLYVLKNNKCIPELAGGTGTFSVSESLSELSELELLQLESLSAAAPAPSLSVVIFGFGSGARVFIAGEEVLGGAEECTGGG